MEDIYIATNKDYKPLVREQLPGIPEENILCEPVGRNTAPCIGLGATHISKKYEDAVMMVLPSDHLIQQPALFRGVLKSAIQTAQDTDALVTLGIAPTSPDTGYGYIQYDTEEDAVIEDIIGSPSYELFTVVTSDKNIQEQSETILTLLNQMSHLNS